MKHYWAGSPTYSSTQTRVQTLLLQMPVTKGACFRCHQKGHMSHQCPRNGKAEYGRPAPTVQARASGEEPKKDAMQNIYDVMKQHLVTEELKEQFIEGIVAQGFV